MGPTSQLISDYESEKQEPRRGRRALPAAEMLAAADALFAASDLPCNITMDGIAAAAGVGKGTLFRAFGSRDGLLDALWATKIAALRERVESGAPPFEADAASQDRLVAFLDEILTFKMENRHLIRARELSTGLLQSPHYRWMHGEVKALVEAASEKCKSSEAIYTAHALLAALHIDLIEEMLANGLSLQAIRQAQAARVKGVIGRVGL